MIQDSGVARRVTQVTLTDGHDLNISDACGPLILEGWTRYQFILCPLPKSHATANTSYHLALRASKCKSKNAPLTALATAWS